MDLSLRRWEHSPLENELPRSVRAKLIEGGEEHMWNAWSAKAGRIKIKYAALFLVNLWSIFLWDEIWEEALTVTKMMIEANHAIAAEREREKKWNKWGYWSTRLSWRMVVVRSLYLFKSSFKKFEDLGEREKQEFFT